MTTPSNKELYARFQKINESEVINESGPEDNAGFKTGEVHGERSQDTHSAPVKRTRESGSSEAQHEYDPKGKDLDTKTGNVRDAGVEKAPDEFEGSKKTANEKTDQKRTENGIGKTPVAKGASKSFAEFRDSVRAKMGLPLDSKLNKGNDGKIN